VAIASHAERVRMGSWASALNLSFTMAACVLVGAGIGWLIDRKVGGDVPWFTFVFVILGMLAGLREAVRFADRSGGPGDRK